MTWTPEMVLDQLKEACQTLRALPGDGPRDVFAQWPDTLPSPQESYGYHATFLAKPTATHEQIERLDQALHWNELLTHDERVAAWGNAARGRTKHIAIVLHCSRRTVYRLRDQALKKIAKHLNEGPRE